MESYIMNYSISNDTLNGVVDTGALAEEIKSSSITIALEGIISSGDSLTVNFKAAISAQEQTELDGLIAAHTGDPIEDVSTIEMKPVLPQGGKRKTDRGFKFTALAGQTTSYEHTFTESLYVKEGIMYTEGHDFFDQISAEFVDKQYIHAGILYPSEPFLAGVPVPQGTPWSAVMPDGVVLHRYIGDFPVDPSGKTHSVNEALTELNMKDLTIRMIYTSVGASDVKCNVGIVAYS